jgi:predicted Zn finger-like uncharacterized protein
LFVLTQCPGCQTVFRITEAILQAAHGQVRCGRCNTQFDAVQNEFEQEELIKPAEPRHSEPAADKTAFMPSHAQSADEATAFMPSSFDNAGAQHEQITMEGDRINAAAEEQRAHNSAVDAGSIDDSVIEIFNIDSDEWHQPFSAPQPAVEQNSPDIFAQPGDSADSSTHSEGLTRVRQRYFDAPDEPLDPESLFAQSDSDTEENPQPFGDHGNEDIAETFNEAIYMTGASSMEQSSASEMIDISSHEEREENLFAEPEGVSAVERTLLRRPAAAHSEQPEPPPDVLEPDQYVAPQNPGRWPLAAACIAMTLLLGFQIIHHYRQTLVRHPTFGPALKSFYSLLGKNLEPRWDVNAYSIKQWGIVSDPQEPGVLRVRASIVNNAAFAQPYPLLKLTLEDRFGTHLGARAFKPIEYLPSVGSATRLLDAGVAANVDLAIVDPGEEAVGFQFDSCLGNDTTMRCAHE